MEDRADRMIKMDDEKKYLQMLGKRIRDLRKAKGYANYVEFAEAHQIGRAQYGRYEKGVNITFANLLRLIHIHDLTIRDFFSEGFEHEEE